MPAADAPAPLPQAPLMPLREWAAVHAELEWVYDHEVAPLYRNWTANAQRRGYWAWYIHEGSVVLTLEDGAALRAGPGEWLFPPRERFHQHFAAGSRILSLHFGCQWPSGENMLGDGARLVIPGREHPRLLRRAQKLESAVRRHFPEAETRYYSRYSDYEHFLECHVLFLQWLAEWYRVSQRHGALPSRMAAGDDRVLRAIRCLNNAPLSQGFPRAALEVETGLGEGHLGRLFFAEYGLTTRKYWEQRRLRTARASLETSNTPIKEISYSLGFRSDAHFVVWFRARTGQRPREYRRVHRENTEP